LSASWSQAGLWLAVIASGCYHGVNPAMGWPLAVSNALLQRKASALLGALCWLAAGHLLAIVLMMLPFALLGMLLAWQPEIQAAASALVIGFGVLLLLRRRHPRVLARIAPSRLALWSFAIALAHGAGLMLVPIYLGLCRAEQLDRAHQAAQALMQSRLGMALAVSGVHAATMMLTGGVIAWLVYRYLGLRFVSRSWFNLDTVWAFSFIAVGALALLLNASDFSRF